MLAVKAMSEEQLKAFLEAAKADTALQEKLKGATDPDAVVAIAKAAGFVISAEELKQAQAEVSEQELEAWAGGFYSGDPQCYCTYQNTTCWQTGTGVCGGR